MEIEQLYDKLLRYCYMKLRDRDLAEDLTQETFIRFFESRNYRSTGKEMAYLYTIARNLCADHFRKKQELLISDLPAETQDELLAGDKEELLADRISIENALDHLDEEEREAVMLRYSGELSVTDIGKTMGLSRFSVRRRLSSALAKLREEMEG